MKTAFSQVPQRSCVDAVERTVATKTEIEMPKRFSYYSLDIMGDMAFGKSFGMLLNGENTCFLNVLTCECQGFRAFAVVVSVLQIHSRAQCAVFDSFRSFCKRSLEIG
ncbi:hypothetical protein BDW71DRAFT_205640 [Aspergillus fruticulosus]